MAAGEDIFALALSPGDALGDFLSPCPMGLFFGEEWSFIVPASLESCMNDIKPSTPFNDPPAGIFRAHKEKYVKSRHGVGLKVVLSEIREVRLNS